ncbi:filamentous hemagglutinin N-terminal domain-containing protein [Agrobacterium tumefaciens]|uniref:Filamentous hemagglutinin N-terminal domain-containing protein n=1 Tax=Agrobacterium tumefaciens TaxID=358 RepID=A0AA44JAA4_AGRTU|nr:filamentous hemagglutinin N-terminal domain-containing protein [Agrobacterium tumefaciens]NSL25109.1 filamentous hemagglutinin N-terminal domain-containing protein [Agrobacterium tumefaciens]NTB86762.1 filamentous hemagglutinin N-terminal domain-containing protein [Agrobacterium tumefaciens]NTC21091.1 filamentous hemagglutinin N-terminal domain-containing protein [Agrobacterium tumefaciens]NTC30639.1 filamentous hemagglutinin N-terminal domain-containing protein [Agrobacterium tumefaciens]N
MRFWRLCLASTALVPLTGQPLWANPLDGNVVQGQATIQGAGTNDLTVTQHTDRAAIEWRGFDIENGERTRFVQPSESSVILNRVTGSQAASRIYGTLESNGTVYLINPDGVLFGPSATVNTGSLLATTHDITDTDFMAGRDRFSLTTDARASVVNEGLISVRDGGFAALVAPGVRNDGIITANYGSIGMSAVGNQFSLDLRGDQLINFAVSDEIAEDVKDVKTGQTLSSLVENKGKLKADGGRVALTAATARKVVDSVINTSGVIEANTVASKGGKIILGAATAGAKAAGSPKQVVRVSGKVSASGKKPSEKGGTVQMTGEAALLTKAAIDTSGGAGGGKILVGGDYKGGERIADAPVAYEDTLIPIADYVYLDEATTLNASATHTGNGGKIILWGNQANLFTASVFNTGGIYGGTGGFVEVSSPNSLSFVGTVDTGVGGQLLLDPHNLIIGSSDLNYTDLGSSVAGPWLTPSFYNTNSTSYISASTIENAMRSNSMVTLFLTSSYGKHGVVSIDANITAPAGHTNLWIIQSSDFIMDVELNAVVDFSASTGQFRIGSTSKPANSITASYSGKIIGNTGYISLDALNVGSASNPIRVEIVPDSDATAANYLLCANYGVCSDTGTRISVIDEYASNAQAFRDHVFVSIGVRDGHTFTPPTTPTDPEPPVVDPEAPVRPSPVFSASPVNEPDKSKIIPVKELEKTKATKDVAELSALLKNLQKSTAKASLRYQDEILNHGETKYGKIFSWILKIPAAIEAAVRTHDMYKTVNTGSSRDTPQYRAEQMRWFASTFGGDTGFGAGSPALARYVEVGSPGSLAATDFVDLNGLADSNFVARREQAEREKW